MLKAFQNFKEDEAGAVTVDWVVLTAAVVGLATLLVIQLQAGSSGLTAETDSFLGSQVVGEIGLPSE
ncbi:hypothetical protein [uncultured Roseobacter sp.]|uniref:hypothetical protein n=1 Tax=uncultured Roseobacter sp. TaxID=114847 RepID=UPI00262A2091|nr:hypothetical protein [uncultured Roseobacter sp.]